MNIQGRKIVDNPSIGSIVTHTGWSQKSKKYPCDVYIVRGDYLVDGLLSNFWYWRRLLDDGKLGEVEKGYGSFVVSDKEYTIEITYKVSGKK
ncbi:hypothetical protein LCGC14_2603300 [marine sediment metagenome]|uniref:Uncharacterized protein n=1 Tax=marine sediment metagenome TaxID=412755 RepID=A0A0F9A8F7_9ZZZZ